MLCPTVFRSRKKGSPMARSPAMPGSPPGGRSTSEERRYCNLGQHVSYHSCSNGLISFSYILYIVFSSPNKPSPRQPRERIIRNETSSPSTKPSEQKLRRNEMIEEKQ